MPHEEVLRIFVKCLQWMRKGTERKFKKLGTTVGPPLVMLSQQNAFVNTAGKSRAGEKTVETTPTPVPEPEPLPRGLKFAVRTLRPGPSFPRCLSNKPS